MPIPGNYLRDNWFMGKGPVRIRTLGDLLSKVDEFTPLFKLTDGHGGNLIMRMGGKGTLIIEPEIITQPIKRRHHDKTG